MRNLLLAIGLSGAMANGAAACSAEPDFFTESDAETLIACLDGAEGQRFLSSRFTDLSTVLHLGVSAEADLRVLDAIRRAAADGEGWPDVRDRVDSEGRTALHLAAADWRKRDVVRWLLQWGADPNTLYAVEDRLNPARYDFGITPLHLAAERPESADIVSALLAGGADPFIRRPPGDTGWTATHVATRHAEDPRVLIALAAGGADLTDRDRGGNTVLHIAAAWDRAPGLTQFLLDAGADANATNNDGQLALHLAARFATQPAGVLLLLDATDDPCAEDDADRTPRELLTVGNDTLGADQDLQRRFHEICVEGG